MTELRLGEREGARWLVAEVWRLVENNVIDARSPAADAALDLRDIIDPNWWPVAEDERPRPYVGRSINASTVAEREASLARKLEQWDAGHVDQLFAETRPVAEQLYEGWED